MSKRKINNSDFIQNKKRKLNISELQNNINELLSLQKKQDNIINNILNLICIKEEKKDLCIDHNQYSWF